MKFLFEMCEQELHKCTRLLGMLDLMHGDMISNRHFINLKKKKEKRKAKYFLCIYLVGNNYFHERLF